MKKKVVLCLLIALAMSSQGTLCAAGAALGRVTESQLFDAIERGNVLGVTTILTHSPGMITDSAIGKAQLLQQETEKQVENYQKIIDLLQEQPVAVREHKAEAAAPAAVVFSGVKKINDDLYVGKVVDQFYLAIERVRVNDKNMNRWLVYAGWQSQAARRNHLKFLQSPDGADHFELVLRDYESGLIKNDNELWVAYASDVPVTKKVELDISYERFVENPHIEMFVTVITSRNALITSHMGISRTFEAARDLGRPGKKRAKHPDQSVHLHSFAAKVMKMLDSRKVYMLTAPVEVMREILIKKMPAHSVFIGDNIYQDSLEAEAKDPEIYTMIAEKIPLLKMHPPRIMRTREGEKRTFIIQKPDGTPLITFDQSTPTYQWMFTDPYRASLFMPYVLVDLDALARVGKLMADTAPSAAAAGGPLASGAGAGAPPA